jgi:excisionase family DNA binding protein
LIGRGRTTDYDDELLTPSEVARLFKVDPKTVTRWAHSGKLQSITTPGGHKRFRRSEVDKYLKAEGDPR